MKTGGVVMLLAAALWLGGVAACSSESERSCGTVQDCFQGEVCRGGLCVAQVDDGENRDDRDAGDGPEPDGDTPSTGDVGDGTQTPDAEASSDTGAHDGSNNGAVDAGPDATGGEATCLVGPFDDCSDEDPYEPNGSYYEYYLISPDGAEHVGCTDWEDLATFQGLDGRLLQGEVCPAGEDHFKLTYEPCKETPYNIDIWFRVTTRACDEYADRIRFELSTASGQECPERDDGAIQYYCYHKREEADGWTRYRIKYPGKETRHDPIGRLSSQIRIYPQGNIRFDYELMVTVSP